MKKGEDVITPHPDCKVCEKRQEQDRKILARAKEVISEYNRKINEGRKN